MLLLHKRKEELMPSFLTKLFPKKNTKKEVEAPIHTTPLSDDQLDGMTKTPVEIKPTQFIIGTGQSVGMQRDHNEDTLFTLSSVLGEGINDLPFGICIIADGMGGHKNGEIASGVAVRVISKYLLNRVYLRFLELHHEPMDESIQETIRNSVSEAQKAVLRYAPGGGTTLTCVLMLGEQITVAHIGDSRGYFIYPDGRIQKITKDHSLVQRMVEIGEITEAEAQTHPQKNVLLRALGQNDPVKPDIQTFQFPKGGYLLLCSDGLWGLVPDNDIYRIVTSNSDETMACHQLIELANTNGGPDNVSVILCSSRGM
jgi:PPM family protein phosphatase